MHKKPTSNIKDDVFAPGETLYAAADKICESHRKGADCSLLKERLKLDIKEDNLRHLLSAKDVRIKLAPGSKIASITIDNKNISHTQRDERLDEIYTMLREVINV